MPYRLVIKKKAAKALKKLIKTERHRVAEKIAWLSDNPDSPDLDIKPLIGSPYYRLRVGKWRVIFDRDDQLKIIAIEKIKPRGDAYK